MTREQEVELKALREQTAKDRVSKLEMGKELGELRAEVKRLTKWNDERRELVLQLQAALTHAQASLERRGIQLTPAQRLVLGVMLLAFAGLSFYLGQQVGP